MSIHNSCLALKAAAAVPLYHVLAAHEASLLPCASVIQPPLSFTCRMHL